MIMRYVALCALVVALTSTLAAGEAQARTTVTLAPQSTKVIRGDLLWMRIASDRALLAPFTIDYRGRWCWAPASVFEESCTVTVGRRKQGRRTLVNGSKVRVRVTFVRHF